MRYGEDGRLEAILSIHVDDVYDEYWQTMLPKLYAKLGEKLAESAAETDDDPAPKRRAAAFAQGGATKCDE